MARNFTAQVVGTEFVITEVAPKTDVLTPGITRELAWQQARTQANPVVFVALDGTRRELGVAFDTAKWEQAMYQGHIRYELSMTDGYYAPESFETWIAEFRKFPRTSYNDALPATIAAFPKYLELAA